MVRPADFWLLFRTAESPCPCYSLDWLASFCCYRDVPPDLLRAAGHAPTPVCAAEGCTNTQGLRKCGGCGTVRYCSEACSRAHWRAHKAECRRLQAQTAGGAAASQPAQG